MDSVKCKYCGKLHNNKTFCSRACKAKWQSTQIPWNKGLKTGKRSKESIIKQIQSRVGYKHSDETKKKIGLGNKGKLVSKETCMKISNAKKGKKPSKLVLDRLRIAFKGRKHSQKTIEQMKKNSYWKGKALTTEHKELLRQHMIKRLSSGEMNNYDTSIEKKVENFLLFNNIYDYTKQYRYKLGVADFYLPTYNVIIECDGDYWHNLPGRKEQDKKQTEYLNSIGFEVIRLSEKDINNDVERCLNWIV